MLEFIRWESYDLPEVVIMIAHTSLITSSPLLRWRRASQVMLEKGKGTFVDNQRIIQLCEADLNFILHVIWGHRLIRHAKSHNALDAAQYALPGQTCNNAVLNKSLFLDLSRQTLTPGVMTDFDATAAFDRVLSGISIVTCQRLGLPKMAGIFMYNLLSTMQFDLITGFGHSDISYRNNDDPSEIGQGVLQGSSSACHLFIVNSDVSLTAYKKLCYGASFLHPISGLPIDTHALQFVDDTSKFLNCVTTSEANLDIADTEKTLLQRANHNAQLWSDLLWVSGGHLHFRKCFFYAFDPVINFKRNSIVYGDMFPNSPLKLHNQSGKQHTIDPIPANSLKCTLGVILAPDGSGAAQLRHSCTKARQMCSMISNSSLPPQTKWITYRSIIEPVVCYPLINSYFSSNKLK